MNDMILGDNDDFKRNEETCNDPSFNNDATECPTDVPPF